MQWWASKVGINYELVYVLTTLPAISFIPSKLTVLAVLSFMFSFLYQKLSLFIGIICPTHILFHLHFHNSFQRPHFILHSSQCFPYLSSSLQFTTTATFGISPCTYSVPNHSVHFSSVLASRTLIPALRHGNVACPTNTVLYYGGSIWIFRYREEGNLWITDCMLFILYVDVITNIHFWLNVFHSIVLDKYIV